MSLKGNDSSCAVLIGTATYNDSAFPPVPAAANSLRGFQAVLTDPELCGWPADRLTVMRDASDPAVVVKQLRELAAESTGVLLVYFVGHGTIASDAKLCLALTATESAHPDITGVEYDRVRRALLASPARIKIVILDCCYSGRAIETLAGPDGIADTADIRGLTECTRGFILAPECSQYAGKDVQAMGKVSAIAVGSRLGKLAVGGHCFAGNEQRVFGSACLEVCAGQVKQGEGEVWPVLITRYCHQAEGRPRSPRSMAATVSWLTVSR